MPDRDDEPDLRAAFEALRREDGAQTPPFETVVAGTRRRRTVPAWALLAAATFAAAVVAGVLLRGPTPPPVTASIGRWTAPTDFLLNTPGREVLETVPRIGTPALLAPPDVGTADPPGQRSVSP